jgi:hypothetical protein
MSFRIVSVSYLEPTLWLAVVLSAVICWTGARFVMARTRTSEPVARIASWSVVLFGSLGAWVLPHVLLLFAYPLFHGANTFACTYFAGWATPIPFVVWSVTLIRAAWNRRPSLAA